MSDVVKAVVVTAAVMVAWYALPFTAPMGAGAGAAAAGGATAIGLSGFAGLTGMTAIAAAAATVVLVSTVAAKLSSRGMEASRENFSSGSKFASRSAIAPRQIIYGECRVGGTITQLATKGTVNQNLCMYVVLSGHPVHSLVKIRLNDEDATLVDNAGAEVSGETVYTVDNANFTDSGITGHGNGKLIQYTFHDGTQTAHDGLARATLGSDEVPDTHKFTNCAYVYIEMHYSPEKLSQMPALSFQVKGKKVYDPRSFDFNANTAVNTTTNVITYKASSGASPDLSTNDAFVYDTNSGTAIGGLTNGTTYYVIYVSATTIKLATTAANANAGTAISLTSKPSSETHKFTVSTFSANSALCVRDYLTDTTYGIKATSDEVNDTTSGGGFAQAANVCDQDVTLADNSTTEKRYTANGFSKFSASGSGLLEGLLSSCAGSLTYTNGMFNCFPAAAQTASLTITDDDLLEPVTVTTASSKNDLYNGVKGMFVDSANSFQAADTPIYVDIGSGSIASPQSGSYLSDDTPSGESTANYKKILEMQHPFTTTHTRSQRLAKISLKNQRYNTTMTCLVGLNFMKLQPKDWVQVTNSRLSYTNKLFEVQSMNLDVISSEGSDIPYLAVRLNLKETAAAITNFTYNEHVAPLATASNLATGSLSVSAPTSLSITPTTVVEGANTNKVEILVTWANNADEAVLGTEIAWSADGTNFQTGVVGKKTARFIISGLLVADYGASAKNYVVKVRHFSFNSVYSVYTSTANANTANPSAPAACSSFTVSNDKPLGVILKWTNPTAASTGLRSVKIHRRNISTTPTDDTYLVATIAAEPSKKMQWTTGADDGLVGPVRFDAGNKLTVVVGSETIAIPAAQYAKLTAADSVTYDDGGGTAIGGLTDGTEYYIIKAGSNNIKLATSAGNASSETAINLTSIPSSSQEHVLKPNYYFWLKTINHNERESASFLAGNQAGRLAKLQTADIEDDGTIVIHGMLSTKEVFGRNDVYDNSQSVGTGQLPEAAVVATDTDLPKRYTGLPEYQGQLSGTVFTTVKSWQMNGTGIMAVAVTGEGYDGSASEDMAVRITKNNGTTQSAGGADDVVGTPAVSAGSGEAQQLFGGASITRLWTNITVERGDTFYLQVASCEQTGSTTAKDEITAIKCHADFRYGHSWTSTNHD